MKAATVSTDGTCRGAMLARVLSYALLALGVLPLAPANAGGPLECANWQTNHPDWLWCDDFESDASLSDNYFDVNRAGGRFGVVSTSGAFSGNGAIKASYLVGAEDAGGIKLSIGKTPVSPKRYTDRNFDEIYWRFYMKTGPNWIGQPRKVTRATIFTSSSWAQAAIDHLWEDFTDGTGMGLDTATGVSGSQVVTTKWNDFDHLVWMGKANGTTKVYAPENRERWFCVEVRWKLNTPGSSDGLTAFWVDGKLEGQKTGLNWRGSYTTYGINAVTLEAWSNGGPPQNQDRYFDNFVVSTKPIGCMGSTSTVKPNPPTDVKAQ